MRTTSKRLFGMTYLQVGILAGLGIFAIGLIGCFAVLVLGRNFTTSIKATEIPLPSHIVNDYWDNGKGTNFAYFIVADKSLTEEEGRKIIAYYEDKHKGYKIINIWIFCDTMYANKKTIDDPSITDDQFFSTTSTPPGLSAVRQRDRALVQCAANGFR